MTKPVLLSISFCLLVLFQGSLARLKFQQQNQCQLSRINALEPDDRIQSEAGTIESWNPNHDQFQCAGVAVTRHIIEPNGLLLPAYSNAPQLLYIVQGRGVLGAMFPGCAETFQESQGSRGSSGSARSQEQHQKIHHFRRGDVIALPAGVASWSYNDGSERLIAVTVYDTANHANQLDNNARNFYLAGNPQEELRQLFIGRPGEFGQSRPRPSSSQGKQGSCNNLFCGLDTRLISEAFNIDEQLARKLQSENDFRGNIVRVEGQLEILRPSRTQQEMEEQPQCGWESSSNGIEETFCTMRLIENIANPSRADVFVPEVGRMSTVNSHKLPVLKWLQLSASHVVLQNSAVRLPHWHMNAHSILYAVRGQAQIQVVDENGNSVFNGRVREGQVLTVPQNFMVVKQAERRGFEYVAFKTNDNAMSSDVAGRTSAILSMPVEVLANAFRISVEEAQKIKSSRQETTFASSRSRSGGVAGQWLKLLKQF